MSKTNKARVRVDNGVNNGGGGLRATGSHQEQQPASKILSRSLCEHAERPAAPHILKGNVQLGRTAKVSRASGNPALVVLPQLAPTPVHRAGGSGGHQQRGQRCHCPQADVAPVHCVAQAGAGLLPLKS